MPADIWYGADCEMRIGRRANATTPPASWQSIEFMQLTVNSSQEWRERPKLGVPGKRQNSLDPIKPRKGFYRVTAELVLDADSRQLPILLRMAMGAPTSAQNGDNEALYDHVWSSGAKTEQYFDIAIKVGTNDVRFIEGLTLATIASQFGGENTQDFDINLSLRGLSRSKGADFVAGDPTACPDEAPILRALYKVDDVAADNTLNASFSYDRALVEGLFLSATPNVTSNRPNAGAAHNMTATFRAVAAAFDTIEEEETVFAAALDLLGVVEDHRILFEQPNSMLAPSPIPITGAGVIERTFNSSGHQTADTAATRITVTNDVAAYA